MSKIITLMLAAAISTFSLSSFAAEKIERVGITVGTLGNPYFQTMVKGIEAGVKKYAPNANITVVSSDYELNRQASQIDSFIASGAQIIFLNAADSVAIKPFVEKAKAAGIIVAAVDVRADGATLSVMTDNVQAGALACEDLAKRINYKGDVVIINGPPTSAVIDRVEGCRDTFSKYHDIKILSDNQDGKGSREGGMQVMQGILTRFPKIDAVFGANDPTAIGAALAARQFNRSEMIISAVDGSPDLIDALKESNSTIVSSAAQDPFSMGELAASQAIDLVNGKSLKNDTTLIDTKIVSKENFDTYIGWQDAH